MEYFGSMCYIVVGKVLLLQKIIVLLLKVEV